MMPWITILSVSGIIRYKGKGGFNNEKKLYNIHDTDFDIQLHRMQEGDS